MSLKTQSKVLRMLDEGRFAPVGMEEPVTVDVRVIAATNKDLEEEIGRGNFREDLFYRLNVVPFVVPPLRERKEDIPVLARHFLKEFCSQYSRRTKEIADEALEVLTRYSWPGNVRELRNVIERIVIMNPTVQRLERKHLPSVLYREGTTAVAGRLYHPAPGARGLRTRLHPEKAGREQRQRQPHGRNAGAGTKPSLPQDEGAGNRGEGVEQFKFQSFRVAKSPVLAGTSASSLRMVREGVAQCGLSDLLLELRLQLVKGADDAQSTLFALWLQGKQVGAGIGRIDRSLQKSLCFQRRDAVAHVAASGPKGFGQLRRLRELRLIEEYCRQHKAFEKTQVVGGESMGGQRVKAARGTIDGKHRAFMEECIDAHPSIVHN